MRYILFIVLSLTVSLNSISAQQIKEYLNIQFDDYDFPVLVRGNMESGKLLIFVQGGPGETAIDFARSDYPKWKNSLEKELAIAYYDQRGLNGKVSQIDSSKITYQQFGLDALAIADYLKNEYKVDVYLFGHSAGGKMIIKALSGYPDQSKILSGAILASTPFTSDYSEARYNHFRPEYLKLIAADNVKKGVETEYWQNAYDWMSNQKVIDDLESSNKWNAYVDQAFEASKSKISLSMVAKVIFSKPYNPVKYLKRKDNDMVGDLLWKDEKNMNYFDDLDQIALPILLMTGYYDNIAPFNELDSADQLIGKSKFVVIENAGHEPFLDNPSEFNQSILNFVLND